MAITVYFSTDSKRENSTKQLTMDSSYSCTFKNGCSMLNPTLFLELDDEDFPKYTAFKIEDRYYNITDIRTVRNNLFEVSGEIDVLATYKTNILATTAYVIYDNVANTELIDNRLPIKTTKTVQSASTPFPWSYLSGGCYILYLTGSNGSSGVYKLTPTELNNLLDDVSNIKDNIFTIEPEPTPPPDTTDVAQAIKNFAKYQLEVFKWMFNNLKLPFSHLMGTGNVTENIRDALYLPFNIGSTVPGPTPTCLGTIPLGTRLQPRTLNLLNNESVVEEVSVSIPWQVNDYRRRSPYTQIYVYLPYIGLIKLSSENLAGQSSINVKYAISLKNGEMICTLTSGSEILGQYSANIACDAPIGISNINLPKTAQSIITGIANLAAKNVSGVGLAALNFADSVTPNYSCIGGLDGLAATLTNQNIVCYTILHDTIVSPNSEIMTIGSPTMAPKSLATLSGFVQTNSASVEGSMSAPERNKINRLLDSGIFIE